MFEKVRDIIVDTLSCEMEDVTMEADLAEDLGADSLDAVELNIALEEQLGLSIADDDRPAGPVHRRRRPPQHEDRGRHRPLSGGSGEQGRVIQNFKNEVTVPWIWNPFTR